MAEECFMTPKKRIENLVRLIGEELPGAGVVVDAPAKPQGDWFVDVTCGEQAFSIEYRPKLGFGLSSPSGGYGEGPDEFLPDEASLIQRLDELVHLSAKTEPQRARLLQDLRSKRQVTQEELADRLGVRQPTVSKLERREDVNLSTLRRYVEALGGELHITAKFSDGAVDLALGTDRR